MRKRLIAAILLFNLVAGQLFAWGPKGHAIIADLAASGLTPHARAELHRLIGDAPLASTANWAEEVRNGRDETYSWHFVNIPREAAGFKEARDCFHPEKRHRNSYRDRHNCVVDRIEIFKAQLADESLSRKQRVEALKWLVHLVGDVQQPLHAIEDARGGNEIKLPVFGSPECGEHPCNLHWAWDTLLLEHSGLSEKQYVRVLQKMITKQRLDAGAGGSAADWADESHEEARRLLEAKPVRVDEGYFEKNIDLVNRKLALGGLRLARVLNEALDPEALTR
jgi:hypothetical protein